MSNQHIQAALDYHNNTNHTRQRLGAGPHRLDPANRPLPYKIYSSLAPLPLLTDIAVTTGSLFSALSIPTVPAAGEHIPNLQTLAQLCFFSNGVTKTLTFGDREFPMRAAACTGALFHIEMYLVCGDLPDLPAGVYHYGAHDNALRQLRAGDFRRLLIDATAAEPSIVSAPVIVLYTSTFWRNAYKYGARAYRHTFWDGGTILANSLTIANAVSMPARVVLGFVDEQVNALLDIDGEHEATIALLSFGHTTQIPPEAPVAPPLHLPIAQLSTYEIPYQAIVTIQQESSLLSPQEVLDWRSKPVPTLSRPTLPAQPRVPLQPAPTADLPSTPVETVIRRRGSTRRFTHEPITFTQFSTILASSLHGIPTDCLPLETPRLNSLYIIANAVEGLEHGTYVYHQERQALARLQTGTFRHAAMVLSLGQDLGGDAAVNIYFLVDLTPVLSRFGNRGYRVAQLEAAIIAGKMYLASYALSLGATGLTFFDNDVVNFFSPQDTNQQVMFLIALGHPAGKKST